MRSLAARCSVKSKRGVNPIAETRAGNHQPRLLRSTSAWRGNCIASGCLHKSILATAARPASSRISQRLSLASHDSLPRFGRGSMSWSFEITFTVCQETLFIPCFLSSPRILVQSAVSAEQFQTQFPDVVGCSGATELPGRCSLLLSI